MIDLTPDIYNIFSSRFYMNNGIHKINSQRSTMVPFTQLSHYHNRQGSTRLNMIDLALDTHNIFSARFYINNGIHKINGKTSTMGLTKSMVVTTWARYGLVFLNLRWVEHIHGQDVGLCSEFEMVWIHLFNHYRLLIKFHFSILYFTFECNVNMKK